MPRYSQGSITTSSSALPKQPYLPNPTNVRGGNWSIAEDEKLCHAWERATNVYYKGQNNSKMFNLEHCWEILRNCAKYSESHGTARTSAIASILLDPPEFQCNRTLNDAVNEDSPTPTIRKRPPGRKTSKEKAHAKRQKSEDVQSSIGDRLVKSIDELNSSSTVDFAKLNASIGEEQQMGMRLKRILMNKERINGIKARIGMERELMAVDAQIYSQHPSLIGTPNDAMKRLAARQAKIEQLTTQADAFLSYNVEEPPTTQTNRNLNRSFDDEADNLEEDERGEEQYHTHGTSDGLEML
ncbi:hypothetical protein Droror1_Dr00023294 [Drosera rotundifolia]